MRLQCAGDCDCRLCRELRHCRAGMATQAGGALGANFILRRALPYVGRLPSKEWQEEAASSEPEAEYGRSATLPEPPRQANHKTVIYFGDTARRPEREAPVPAPRDSLDANRAVIEVEAEPPEPEEPVEAGDQHEIVISVKPCRADVLRIEEEESRLEDYWSLPGDTTGFKADWSFVQQWRLRG